jgi:hypothetical protein
MTDPKTTTDTADTDPTSRTISASMSLLSNVIGNVDALVTAVVKDAATIVRESEGLRGAVRTRVIEVGKELRSAFAKPAAAAE